MHASSDDLDLLSVLSVDQAENLVMHSKDCPLWLYNLCELSPAVAEALAKHKGDIYFLSLINLSDAGAEAIRKHHGHLKLSGLTSLSEAAAVALGKHHG
jgi:hypothetical protein